MGGWFRSRVGVALTGAVIIGCIAAAIGASTLALRSSPLDGVFANSGSSATATAKSTETPEATVTPAPTATATPQPTATNAPRPTATPLGVGSFLHGTVLGTPGASSFVMSRNGIHYTIQVDGDTMYSGAATQISGLHNGYRVTVRIKAVYGSTTYLASSVSSDD